MYRRQRGVKPIFSNLASGVFFFIASVMSIQIYLIAGSLGSPFLAFILVALMPWMVFIPVILLYASKYPDFKFTKDGVQYRYLQFFGGLIRWEEISGLLSLSYPKSMIGIYALKIEREGYRYPFWFKGLYFQTMHSIRLRTYAPVILITPESISDEEKRKIKEIINNPAIFDE